MNDSPEAGAMDKGKRLALMMSMGFGYFKAKRALEEHDWDVDEAVASSLSTTKEEKADSGAKGKRTESTKDTSPPPVPGTNPKHADEPKVSVDHIAVKSLKRQTPHSKPHDQVPAGKTLPAVPVASGGGSHVVASDSSSKQEMKRDPPGLKVHEADEDNNDEGTHEESEEYNEKQDHPLPNEEENFEEITRNVFRSTPGAFREGGDGDATTAWDSLMPDPSLPSRPYLAVAETVSVPELVTATLQAPVMSAVTTPFGGPIDLPSEAGIRPEEEEDKSAVERSYGERLTRRRSLYVFAAAILVLIALAVGLAVTQTRSKRESASNVPPTSSPTVATPTPEPSTISPTLASIDVTIQSPTTEPTPATPTTSTTSPPSASPTQAPTKQPTPAPTQLPTAPPTQPPTTAQPVSRPTEPPDVPVTASPTPPPTVSPTSPPTIPPTVPPTREPTSPPTPRPTPIPTTPPPPPPEDLRVERAEMVLSEASSLDSDARRTWSNVTARFILDEAVRVIKTETSSYDITLSIVLSSQSEVDDELTLNFSVEFEIDSSLESHDVDEYVLGAFDSRDKRSEYINELQDADSSFENVFDVKVSV